MNIAPKLLLATLCVLPLVLSEVADARAYAESPDGLLELPGGPATDIAIVQRGGVSLSEAIAQVRRRGDVERIIDAKTQTSGGREVHVIKVLTKDGKVQTHRIPGRKR